MNPGDRNRLIGERVRHYRKQQGMSLETLAGKLLEHPTSYQQLSKYENGATWPADLVAEISLLLTVPVENLLGMDRRP